MKKTLLSLLAVGSVRIISDNYEENLFETVMEANSWEEEEGKVLIEFQVGQEVTEDDQWALDMSGHVAYVTTVDEFVDSFNLALEAASFPEQE